MIQTIFLDLDDTLLDFHKAEAKALEKTLLQMDVEPTKATLERYSVINARQWELLEEGRLTRDQVLLRRFEILFEELHLKRDAAVTRTIYEKALGAGHYFMPGAPELLDTLSLHYDLYLMSNGTAAVQAGRIKSAGIARYFKEIFISQNVGYNKPDPRFFECCFAQIPQFCREQAIIIGDSLTSDIRGGINSGIRTCWYNPQRKTARADILADYEVADLLEIPQLLAKI